MKELRHAKGHETRKGAMAHGLVGVAIDKDKGSQEALKWALDNLLSKGHTVILIHVVHKSPSAGHVSYDNGSSVDTHQFEKLTKDLFLTFHCYCIRKDVHNFDVVLHDNDTVKALTEYLSHMAIENLVLGSSHHSFIKKLRPEIPSCVAKGAPDFCNVYVINKGRIASVRHASRPPPFTSPLLKQIQNQNKQNDQSLEKQSNHSNNLREKVSAKAQIFVEESIKSPFGRSRACLNGVPFTEFHDPGPDISFVSSRTSTNCSPSDAYDPILNSALTTQFSNSSETDFSSMRCKSKFDIHGFLHEFSSPSHNGRTSNSNSSDVIDDMEAEMRRLKIELRQTMDLYSTACKEAITAKKKAMELHRWRIEEERKLEEALHSEEAALLLAENERSRCKAYMEAAEAAKKIAEMESQRRLSAEMKANKEVEDMKKALDTIVHNEVRYRRYRIDEIEHATDFFSESRKIGEGGYGPVFKGFLDRTPVAVKVLRPNAVQGRQQFQQEIEVLSLIRHPNMVLLLGACPEYGILAYEYMAKGSLEDLLFRKGNTPVLSWRVRFRIAAEIATGLLFLHNTKPKPLVHRDLKPGNILLDSNYVSKISDVGLARLVPSAAENATQYHVTATAGTYCYIDPEYQQTGILGVQSDVYSFGILLLQLITAKPPMALAHQVEQAIGKGTLQEILDPDIHDWPAKETLQLAKLAIQCAELRRKDRPDLGSIVLPVLNILRESADKNANNIFDGYHGHSSPNYSHASLAQEEISEHLVVYSGSIESLSSTVEGS